MTDLYGRSGDSYRQGEPAMTETDTLYRSLHDLGLAAWFGGTLMGAVGVNGAANEVVNPRERARVASAGWGRWVPIQAAAIGAHLVGGAGLLVSQRRRAVLQSGTRANTAVKAALTGVALGVTAYSRVLGRKVDEAGYVLAEGGAKPASETPNEVAKAQQQLRMLQWVIPAITGAMVVLTSQQGEQQRPAKILAGTAKTFAKKLNPAA
jgi:hypothetical protein